MANRLGLRGGALRLLGRTLPDDLMERLQHMQFADRGHGYDAFGLTPDGVGTALAVTRPLYERWFRVQSHDNHHMNVEGGAVFACNHSGTLPFDAMMVWNDMVRHSDPPRVPRTVVDYFVNLLPFVSVLFTRAGAVGGSRGNFHELLRHGEWILVFPEGVPGIGKPFKDRYKLQHFREGHAELAIAHNVPVVPVAVVGAEEQMPQLARLPIQAFGSPYIPITPNLFPLPVRYHIYYGEPIPFHERYPPEAANDPTIVRSAALEVRDAVAALLQRGLAERQGVFR